MMNERFWLLLATLTYGATVLGSCYRIPNRLFKPTPWLFSSFLVALGFHTLFLIQRGNAIKHCPVSNLFEVLVFVAWSLGLAYVIVGPLYRMTLLGALTGPLILILLIYAQLFVSDIPSESFPKSVMLEWHAALNILAYGALGLAGLTGIIFLLQESWIKNKKFIAWLSFLPSLPNLARAQRHLLSYGLILLTAGIVTGLFIPEVRSWFVIGWAVLIWGFYTILLISNFFQKINGKKTALCSLVLYLMLLFTFWNAKHIPYS